MLRAIAYIRVSTDRQVTDGSSLITQRRRVVEYVAARSYHLVKQFVEEGESAKTDNRPVLQEMLSFCRENKGGIDVLVFPKIDRFARYSEDYHHLKARLRELGIRVESIDERFDDSPAGKFLESMLAATAQFDNDVRSERTYNGMKEAVRQGRWVWRAPTGYRNVVSNGRRTIEPDPDVAPLVMRGFEKIASGSHSVAQLKKWFNMQGVKIGRNGVYSMLRNKVYTGVIEGFGLKVRAEPPMIPLISESLFRRAAEAIRPKNYPPTLRRDNPEFALRGTVHCSCGLALTASWSTGRRERYPYYRCRKCSRVNLRREVVEQSFYAFLTRFSGALRYNGNLREDLRTRMADDASELLRTLNDLKAMRDRIVRVQRSLVLKAAEGVVPDHLASQQIEEFEAQLREINLKLDDVDGKEVEPPFESLWQHGQAFLDQVHVRWQQGGLVERQAIQRLFFPHGATIASDFSLRTAKEPPSTDLKASSALVMYPLVAHGDKTANRSVRQPTVEEIVIQFLRDVYSKFPPP